jgi:hypothetical protein
MKAAILRSAHKRDQLFQAEAFVALLSRLGPSADLDAEFVRWSDSKDFLPRDRLAIAGEVRGLLMERPR